MKVRLLTARASLRETNKYGDIIDVSDTEGKALIATGQASPVRNDPSVVETAVVRDAGVETTSKSQRRNG